MSHCPLHRAFRSGIRPHDRLCKIGEKIVLHQVLRMWKARNFCCQSVSTTTCTTALSQSCLCRMSSNNPSISLLPRSGHGTRNACASIERLCVSGSYRPKFSGRDAAVSLANPQPPKGRGRKAPFDDRGELFGKLRRARRPREVEQCLEGIGSLESVKHYGMAISAWGRARDAGAALALLGEMRARGVAADLATYACALQAVVAADELELGFELLGAVHAADFGELAGLEQSYALHRALFRQTAKPDRSVYKLVWEIQRRVPVVPLYGRAVWFVAGSRAAPPRSSLRASSADRPTQHSGLERRSGPHHPQSGVFPRPSQSASTPGRRSARAWLASSTQPMWVPGSGAWTTTPWKPACAGIRCSAISPRSWRRCLSIPGPA